MAPLIRRRGIVQTSTIVLIPCLLLVSGNVGATTYHIPFHNESFNAGVTYTGVGSTYGGGVWCANVTVPPPTCVSPPTPVPASGLWQNYVGTDLVSPHGPATVDTVVVGGLDAGRFVPTSTSVKVTVSFQIDVLLTINITCSPGQTPLGMVQSNAGINLWDVSTHSWVYTQPIYPVKYAYSYTQGCPSAWVLYFTGTYTPPAFTVPVTFGQTYDAWGYIFFEAYASAQYPDETVYACNDFQPVASSVAWCAPAAHHHNPLSAILVSLSVT